MKVIFYKIEFFSDCSEDCHKEEFIKKIGIVVSFHRKSHHTLLLQGMVRN